MNWLRPNLREYPDFSMEYPSKATKHSAKIIRTQAEILILKLHIPLCIVI